MQCPAVAVKTAELTWSQKTGNASIFGGEILFLQGYERGHIALLLIYNVLGKDEAVFACLVRLKTAALVGEIQICAWSL